MPVGYGRHNTFEITQPCDVAAVERFLLDELDKSYDYGSVLRFVSREQAARRDSGKWFCSELVFAALQKGGLNLLSRIEPWAVSPGLLAYSPYLKQITNEPIQTD